MEYCKMNSLTSCLIFIKMRITHRNILKGNGQKYFEIVKYVERGINDHQDAVLLRKR